MIQLLADDVVAMLRDRWGPGYKLNQAQVDNINGLCDHQGHLIQHGLLDNRFRVMHLVSQLCHESAHFKTLVEYASGTAYCGRQDLGNTQPGDGPRFKGRGYIMLTGRYNYRTVGGRIGVDLENNPPVAAQPEIAVQTSGDYWTSRNINRWADGDAEKNVQEVTKAINGGLNGYDDRLAYFMSAGVIWHEGYQPEPVEPPVEPPSIPVPPEPGGMPEQIVRLFADTAADQIRQQEGQPPILIWNRPSDG